MKRYAIKVQEVLKRTVIVNAGSIDEALQLVQNAVDRDEILLGIDDFDCRKIEPSDYFLNGEISDHKDVSHFWHLEVNALPLEFVGMDHCDRPVYKNGERLFVDVDPRKDRESAICTVLNNVFGGEPDTPISVMTRYKDMQPVFIPKRIVW